MVPLCRFPFSEQPFFAQLIVNVLMIIIHNINIIIIIIHVCICTKHKWFKDVRLHCKNNNNTIVYLICIFCDT